MKKSRFFAGFAAAAIAASMFGALPASAAGTDYTPLVVSSTTDTNYSTSFDKYLVMKNTSSVPDAEFEFAVSAGAAVQASAAVPAQGKPTDPDYVPAVPAKLAVLPGVDADNIKIYSGTDTDTTKNELTIASTDAATAESAKTTADAAVFATAATDDEQFVKKSLKVDLSGVTFTEPGVYRYIIAESVTTGSGITNGYEGEGTAPINKRTLDVYVKDATDATGKKLAIEGYVLYKGEVTGAPNATRTNASATPLQNNGAEVDGAVKSNSITNYYGTQSITFGKEVTGNQGSKDKYFEFTVALTNAAAGTVYTVDISNADAKSGTNSATIADNQGQDNVTSFSVAANATGATQKFYLQDGQYITIYGLAVGTHYEISENAEDYTATEGITAANNASGEAYTDDVSGDIESVDIKTGFTNDRTGAIPTGVILSIAGPAIVGIAVVGGIIFMTVKRKKEDAED